MNANGKAINELEVGDTIVSEKDVAEIVRVNDDRTYTARILGTDDEVIVNYNGLQIDWFVNRCWEYCDDPNAALYNAKTS